MTFELTREDITQLKVDAIVNAANSSLLGGGGVDGAIHRAGGSRILDECREIRNRQGGCKVGEAVITSAGKLPAKYVIHTVGPRWNGGGSNEETLLRNCYLHVHRIAEEKGVVSLAIPNISTGIYGFPKALAAEIAIDTLKALSYKSLKRIVFACFDAENYALYVSKLDGTKGN